MQTLKYLGEKHTQAIAGSDLDTVPCPHAGMRVVLDCSEFTSHCPITRQPDFARIVIDYVADTLLVETKSLKLWLWSWRERADFNEKIVADIAEAFAKKVTPVRVVVTGHFHARGGISVSPSVTIERGL